MPFGRRFEDQPRLSQPKAVQERTESAGNSGQHFLSYRSAPRAGRRRARWAGAAARGPGDLRRGARLTCAARRRGGGQKQQERRQERRGRPGASGPAEGHGCAAATSPAGRGGAPAGAAAEGAAPGRQRGAASRAGESRTSRSPEPGRLAAFRGEGASRGRGLGGSCLALRRRAGRAGKVPSCLQGRPRGGGALGAGALDALPHAAQPLRPSGEALAAAFTLSNRRPAIPGCWT